jgi:hypothetical protein
MNIREIFQPKKTLSLMERAESQVSFIKEKSEVELDDAFLQFYVRPWPDELRIAVLEKLIEERYPNKNRLLIIVDSVKDEEEKARLREEIESVSH